MGKVVAGDAESVLGGLVGEGGEGLDAGPGGGEARGGDLVVGEELAVGTVGTAGERIVDITEAGIGGEVAGAHIGGGDGEVSELAGSFGGFLVAEEVEKLVLDDGPAEGKAGDVNDGFGEAGTIDVLLEEVGTGVKVIIVVVPKGRAADLIGAGFGDDGDGCAAGHALLGVEGRRRDVDGFDGLDGRIVEGVVGEPDIDVGGTVDAGVVVVAIGAVNVRREGAGWGGADRVLEGGGGGTGDKIHHALEVAVSREGKLDDSL